MTREEAEIYAKTMTYEDALYNLSQARAIPYRKATLIKVNELIQALSQEPCEKSLNKEYTFGKNKGVRAYYNEQLCTVELPEAVFRYILSLVPTEEAEQEPCETSTDEPMTMVYPTIFCDDAVSRQAVLETLDDMDNVLDEDRTVENYKELLKECYEVLPSVTQKPIECDDAVSRDAVLKLIDEYNAANVRQFSRPITGIASMRTDVRELPSVSTTKNIVNHGTMNITL